MREHSFRKYILLKATYILLPSVCHKIDNQLLGTTQPIILSLTPNTPESETEPVEFGPAVQINAMKIPSKNALTELFKVSLE